MHEIVQILDAEIARLQEVRAVLTDGQVKAITPNKRKPTHRKMSAAAKARIAAAQRARWAKVKAAQKKK